MATFEIAGSTKEYKKKKRAAVRESRRQQELNDLEEMDILEMGQVDMDSKAEQLQLQRQEEEAAAQQPQENEISLIISFVRWVLRKDRRLPPPWMITRIEEVEDYLAMHTVGIMALMPKRFWYWWSARRSVQYWGDKDQYGAKEGRGVAYWPDPPKGGGETYYGMWRDGSPSGHGCFRWYYGDMYIGEWREGRQEGYGCYSYSALGPHPNDRYEGSYHANHRNGTGVYTYAGENGGVYLGEWARGAMMGHGMMLYPDGEHYIGKWRNDLKHGLGIYVWGSGAGEVAGDKYEGYFQDGHAHGDGRTFFNDGGWHKGRYAKGKMNGWGMMRTADAHEYVGQWREDELHGEVMCIASGGTSGAKKEVQKYNKGELVGTRAYDISKDWAELEAIGYAAARNGEEAGLMARENRKTVTDIGKRSKLSQRMAKDAAEEARYYAKAAIKYRDFRRAWWGLKKYVSFDED